MNSDMNEFSDFLSEEELSDNTISAYITAVNSFFKFKNEVSKSNIIAWKKDMLTKWSPKTVNLRLTAMKKYCRFKKLNIEVKPVKIHKVASCENVITIEQYNKLVAGLEKDGETRWVMYVKILAKTGARISEALKLKKSDLTRGYAELSTKGKIRRIYIPKKLVNEVSEYFEDFNEDDLLFKNFRGKAMTSRGVSGRLKKFAARYGIPPENVYPHSFRHLFAMEFLKRNKDISLLADLLGHSGVNTTMIYLRMSQVQQKDAIDSAVCW